MTVFNTVKQYRNKSIDGVIFLNVVFILVILYLHSVTYTTNYFQFLSDYHIVLFLQKFAVGGFLFLSGYKLMKAKSTMTVPQFFRNRISRVYWPYLFALAWSSVTTYFVRFGVLPGIKHFILHAFCLQAVLPNFFQKDFRTLWFVSMLFCCYLFFLTSRRLLQTKSIYFICFLLLVSLGANVLAYFGAIYHIGIFRQDWNVYLYFFAAGMLFSVHAGKIIKFFAIEKKRAGIVAAFAALFACALVILCNNAPGAKPWGGVLELIMILLSAVPIYFLVFIFEHKLVFPAVLNAIFHYIAYSSFFVFLFHRSIWTIMYCIWREASFPQWIFMVVLGVPIIIITSFAGQKFYNRISAIGDGKT